MQSVLLLKHKITRALTHNHQKKMKDVFLLFGVSKNVLPLSQNTSAEWAVLHCAPGRLAPPTANRLWPHGAQTSSRVGLSDLISSSVCPDRVSTCTDGCSPVIPSLRMHFKARWTSETPCGPAATVLVESGDNCGCRLEKLSRSTWHCSCQSRVSAM